MNIVEAELTRVGAGLQRLQPSLPAGRGVETARRALIERAFETFSARKINEMRPSTGTPVGADNLPTGEAEGGFENPPLRSELAA